MGNRGTLCRYVLRDALKTPKSAMITLTKKSVDFGRVIGKYYDRTTGKYYDTTKATIHYDSKGNAHIVPARPNGFK